MVIQLFSQQNFCLKDCHYNWVRNTLVATTAPHSCTPVAMDQTRKPFPPSSLPALTGVLLINGADLNQMLCEGNEGIVVYGLGAFPGIRR
jgi:hypothetical protein